MSGVGLWGTYGALELQDEALHRLQLPHTLAVMALVLTPHVPAHPTSGSA